MKYLIPGLAMYLSLTCMCHSVWMAWALLVFCFGITWYHRADVRRPRPDGRQPRWWIWLYGFPTIIAFFASFVLLATAIHWLCGFAIGFFLFGFGINSMMRSQFDYL